MGLEFWSIGRVRRELKIAVPSTGVSVCVGGRDFRRAACRLAVIIQQSDDDVRPTGGREVSPRVRRLGRARAAAADSHAIRGERRRRGALERAPGSALQSGTTPTRHWCSRFSLSAIAAVLRVAGDPSTISYRRWPRTPGDACWPLIDRLGRGAGGVSFEPRSKRRRRQCGRRPDDETNDTATGECGLAKAQRDKGRNRSNVCTAAVAATAFTATRRPGSCGGGGGGRPGLP